jgi:lipoprotein-releasing system ATP-binding protein
MKISIQNLSKTYTNSLGNIDREVLNGLDIVIESGQKIAVMGPSGSGKTTLLNLIGTLDTPDSGSITYDNIVAGNMSANETLSFRNTRIGFVFQFHHLLPQCTLWENVLLPTLPNKDQKKASNQRAEQLLKLMGIWDQRDNLPGELSGGECQRTAVARALINQPQLLLADEPTGSLDSKNAKTLMELLIRINKEMNITLVIATHSQDVSTIMDKIYHIEDGKLYLTR